MAARPRERATKAERGAGSAAAVPRSGAALDPKYGAIRQCCAMMTCAVMTEWRAERGPGGVFARPDQGT